MVYVGIVILAAGMATASIPLVIAALLIFCLADYMENS